ncbi:cytochrome C oxidase subunit IV family protein [Flagellimonas onchidii]|uniref:cytochrome C oxidase subunit IV family protein n=1 Tax=Flagellimonas onchidii TaxID=2562684 RepID=UPI0010A60875|nr:cytochrome C oxidase subunit IV family protein [Allomuricauda onchidii]
MDKTTTITWVFLLVLTILASFLSGIQGIFLVISIMILAGLKFLGVAFEFMELKKAHSFWKIIILSFLILFITIILIIS